MIILSIFMVLLILVTIFYILFVEEDKKLDKGKVEPLKPWPDPPKLTEGATKSNVKTQSPSMYPSKPPQGVKDEVWEELSNVTEECEKNKGELFKSFETYYLAHENQRFWQALRNWSKYDAIIGSKIIEVGDRGTGGEGYTTKEKEDTFYIGER